jgi:GTP cyclohydrolase I
MGEDRLERISYHIGEIIKVLDLDLKDPNLRDTPRRFAEMYLEIFQGLDEEKEPGITVFPNDDGIDDMVVMNDIVFFSMCAHHLLPFFGRAHVAYIPTDRIVGLSKLPRMVEYYARRPQIQERMTHQIADHFEREISPQGSMVVVEARHLCMEMRGVEKPGAWTTTSSVRGVFRKDRASREEFLNLVAMRREA